MHHTDQMYHSSQEHQDLDHLKPNYSSQNGHGHTRKTMLLMLLCRKLCHCWGCYEHSNWVTGDIHFLSKRAANALTGSLLFICDYPIWLYTQMLRKKIGRAIHYFPCYICFCISGMRIQIILPTCNSSTCKRIK